MDVCGIVSPASAGSSAENPRKRPEYGWNGSVRNIQALLPQAN